MKARKNPYRRDDDWKKALYELSQRLEDTIFLKGKEVANFGDRLYVSFLHPSQIVGDESFAIIIGVQNRGKYEVTLNRMYRGNTVPLYSYETSSQAQAIDAFWSMIERFLMDTKESKARLAEAVRRRIRNEEKMALPNPTYRKFTKKDFYEVLESNLGISKPRQLAYLRVFDDLELEYDLVQRYDEEKQLARMLSKRIKDIGFTEKMESYIESVGKKFAENTEKDELLAVERMRWVAEQHPVISALAAHGDPSCQRMVKHFLKRSYGRGK